MMCFFVREKPRAGGTKKQGIEKTKDGGVKPPLQVEFRLEDKTRG
jgi:hypothetical protein